MHSSRIDQARERVDQLRTQLKEEVTTEVVAEQRRARWRRVLLRFAGCCVVYLVGLLVAVGVGAYLVARTGLVAVPVLSGHVAHTRQPVRMVVPVPVADVEQRIAREAMHAARNGTAGTLTVTEGEATAMLRAALQGAEGDAAGLADTAQVAAEDGVVELFGRLPRGTDTTTILLRGVPAIREGHLAVDVRTAAIGTLGIPRSLAGWFLTNALRKVPITLTGGDLPVLTITDITVDDRAVHLTFAPSHAISPPSR